MAEQRSRTQRSATELEYLEAGRVHRAAAWLMFGQMAVYLAATAALVAALNPVHMTGRVVTVAVIGLVLSVIFFLITQRTGNRMREARQRLLEIEEDMDLSLYSAGEQSNISPRRLTEALYALGAVGWVILLALV